VAKRDPCHMCNLCWYGSETAGGHWGLATPVQPIAEDSTSAVAMTIPATSVGALPRSADLAGVGVAVTAPDDASCWCCVTFAGKSRCQYAPTSLSYPFNQCDISWIKNVAKRDPCHMCNLCWYGSETAGGHWGRESVERESAVVV